VMGTKVRAFAPLCNRSLEDLVPADHFYRHLEAKLDLGFVRDLVRDTYKGGGRPSVDPKVFFKLQLVLCFEGIRSERELIKVAADRLSVRWQTSPREWGSPSLWVKLGPDGLRNSDTGPP
jgi:transposase